MKNMTFWLTVWAYHAISGGYATFSISSASYWYSMPLLICSDNPKQSDCRTLL